MDAFEIVEGQVAVLDRADVDTDQIIPKQFLKRVERTGFGEFLFYDWAKEPGWDLPANPILATGRNFGSGSSRSGSASTGRSSPSVSMAAAKGWKSPSASSCSNAWWRRWSSRASKSSVGSYGAFQLSKC